MKFSKLHIFLTSAALMCAGLHAAAQQQPVTVRAAVDSTSLIMGDRTALRVEVLKNGHAGAMFNLPKVEPGQPNEFAGVEIRELSVDSTQLPGGRMQLNYTFTVQPFEPGMVTFPAFKYVVGVDTFRSDITTLKVVEPPMPKEMVDSLYINPMEGVVSIPGRWYDWVPAWWYWAVIGAALIALIIVAAMLYKKNGPTLLPRKKVVPPYEMAVRRLEHLKSRKLAENGHEKEYYTELTDILRQYLEGRFGISAREMSTTQILDAMNGNPDTNPWTAAIAPLLETADFVKFAKVRPLPDENIRSFNTVHDLVEQTKPVPEVDEADKSAKKGAGRRVGKKRKNRKKH